MTIVRLPEKRLGLAGKSVRGIRAGGFARHAGWPKVPEFYSRNALLTQPITLGYIELFVATLNLLQNSGSFLGSLIHSTLPLLDSAQDSSGSFSLNFEVWKNHPKQYAAVIAIGDLKGALVFPVWLVTLATVDTTKPETFVDRLNDWDVGIYYIDADPIAIAIGFPNSDMSFAINEAGNVCSECVVCKSLESIRHVGDYTI